MTVHQAAHGSSQPGLLTRNDDDVAEHEREQISVLQHRHEVFRRASAKRMHYQVRPAVNEGMHHLNRFIEPAKFEGRSGATAAIASSIAGIGGPI
jgi:hypothetical protein